MSPRASSIQRQYRKTAMSASFHETDHSYLTLFKENKKLSNRERQIADLVASGMANKEIADDLFITEKTVKFHCTNIYKKCCVKSRSQLIVLVSKYRSNEPMIVSGEVGL
jgi:DNA-binding NarL/FixJ family response regulator